MFFCNSNYETIFVDYCFKVLINKIELGNVLLIASTVDIDEVKVMANTVSIKIERKVYRVNDFETVK
jgi:hypothetical protein